jgi:hypothetical protein
MTARFGVDEIVDISQLEAPAMFTWAQINAVERAKEVAFWVRFIGNSRARLADAFNVIAPGGTVWMKDSPNYVEQIIGAKVLARLFAELPDDPSLSPKQQEGLDRLRRFLAGELRVGEILGEPAIGANVIGEAPGQPWA